MVVQQVRYLKKNSDNTIKSDKSLCEDFIDYLDKKIYYQSKKLKKLHQKEIKQTKKI